MTFLLYLAIRACVWIFMATAFCAALVLALALAAICYTIRATVIVLAVVVQLALDRRERKQAERELADAGLAERS